MTKNNSTTKKCFIIAVIAMMTLAACTKLEDTAPPRKITFDKATYRPQTKAEVSVMSEFTSFRCKAFLYASNGENSLFPVQYMFGDYETISPYLSNDALWTAPQEGQTASPVAYWAPSHDYFWPKGASSYINFIAWHDNGDVDPSTINETSLIWSNYTVDSLDNLLFANEAWRYNGNPNSIYHKDGEGGNYKAVPMLFNHALAQICIKAQVSRTEKTNVTGGYLLGHTTWDVTLSNISLTGVYNTGTLSLINSDPNSATTREWTWTGADTGSLPWTTSGNTTTITMYDVTTALPSATDPNTDPVELLAMRSVLPQAVTNDMVLSFDFNIVTKFGTEGHEVEYAHENVHTSIKLSDFVSTIANWEMNKRITYTVTINPETTTIKIDPAMVDWLTDSAVYPNPNQNNGN